MNDDARILTAENRSDHPATFPPELAEAGIKTDTVVLDPFCGVNGMVAVARLGVNGIGIETDPIYCEEARRRVGTIVTKSDHFPMSSLLNGK